MSLGFSPDTPAVPTEDLSVVPWTAVNTSMAGWTSSNKAAMPATVINISWNLRTITIWEDLIAQSLGVQDRTFQVIEQQLEELLALATAYATGGGVMVQENIVATTSYASQLSLVLSMIESVGMQDQMSRILEIVLSESGLLDGTFAPAVSKVTNVLDLIEAFETSAAVLRAVVSMAEAIDAAGYATIINEAMITATLALADAATTYKEAGALLSEMISITPTVSGTAVFTLVTEDGLVLRESMTLGGAFSMMMNEGVQAFMSFNVGGEVFTCWCTNAENLATSEYRGFNFNSLAIVNGRQYAAGEAGIHLLEGDTDAGAPIASHLLTGLMNFGSAALKHVPGGYISRTANGDMVMKVVTTTDGRKQVNSYTVKNTVSDTYRATQVQFGKGLRAKYWQFELSNVAGADFAVDQIELSPAVLLRRI